METTPPDSMPAVIAEVLARLPAPLRSERGLMLLAGTAVVLAAGIVYAILAMAHVI